MAITCEVCKKVEHHRLKGRYCYRCVEDRERIERQRAKKHRIYQKLQDDGFLIYKTKVPV